MHLPVQYQWLNDLQLPRMITEALQLHGIKEVPGPINAPPIMAWASTLGLSNAYKADSIPWCGLFAGIVVKRSGWLPVVDPLWARNWAQFGIKSPAAGLGDILVFKRDGGGHVGFYIAEDSTHYHVLGGNQGDAVSIVRIAKDRCIAARRPKWRIGQPISVKPYHVAPTGKISKDES